MSSSEPEEVRDQSQEESCQSNKMMTMGHFPSAKLFILPVKCVEKMNHIKWNSGERAEVNKQPQSLNIQISAPL